MAHPHRAGRRMILMPPDATRHNPSPDYLRELIARSGHSIRAAARQIGVGERTMRQYLAGQRTHADGSVTPCVAPYPVQYALERLAGVAR